MKALVTGAGRRVGRAIALELASHGLDVCVHYRASRDEAEDVAGRCRSLGVDAFTAAADLADPAALQGLVRAVDARWGGLNVLVNNASAFVPVPFEQITVGAWDRMHAVNVRAPFLLAQGLLGHLRAARGLVVQMVDIGAERPVRGYAHYSTSKAAAAMLVRAMAVELGPEVRAVGVSPGQVAWPPGYDAETRARLTRRIPLQRVGTPEDVARLVRFLALEGGYLSGEIIAIDGGLSARY